MLYVKLSIIIFLYVIFNAKLADLRKMFLLVHLIFSILDLARYISLMVDVLVNYV
jgi:hypothetical protein